jgi:hypothetical protein
MLSRRIVFMGVHDGVMAIQPTQLKFMMAFACTTNAGVTRYKCVYLRDSSIYSTSSSFLHRAEFTFRAATAVTR